MASGGDGGDGGGGGNIDKGESWYQDDTGEHFTNIST